MPRRANTSGISLRQRLVMLTLLISGIGLLLGCGAVLLFAVHDAKVKAAEELHSIAELIGTNAAAALAFDDALNGEKLLAALHTRPHIRGAALYRADGQFFASYLRPDLNGKYLFPKEPPAELEWTDAKVTMVRPIVLNDKLLGKILIESDLEDLRKHTRMAIRVTAGIFAGVLLAIYFLTLFLGR